LADLLPRQQDLLADQRVGIVRQAHEQLGGGLLADWGGPARSLGLDRRDLLVGHRFPPSTSALYAGHSHAIEVQYHATTPRTSLPASRRSRRGRSLQPA